MSLLIARCLGASLLMLAAVSMPGCPLTPKANLAQLQEQTDVLTARVEQLEVAQGIAPPPPSADIALQEAAISDASAPQASRFQFPWRNFGVKQGLGKLVRGLTNIVTGWVEIPKRVHETTERSGAAAGFTYGLLRGLGYGFVRTAAGAYETITFPVPAPPDFRPVMQPPYVFCCETSSASSER